ncbi:hypothetical protein N7537_000144 [Penicillium hordei]|uniref:HNH nuclease domain-containing protein n=1 Tax=Penicillium hordei TaxID=40994 RepID=A0AAD6H730_9EURO|nr:uncharacterized protein N7537_000144 [Penicillium hordei]KAJ5615030.1 hypothetical protein N7537_000144 [Penicillium hordei]
MAARILEDPRDPDHNVRIYDNDGALLAAFRVSPDSSDRYHTSEMLYRYCSMIFIFQNQSEWSIFYLHANGVHGQALRVQARVPISPGNYIVLDKGGQPITVQLTTQTAPRRVRSRDYRTESAGQNERDRLQKKFRDGLRTRDTHCVISGPPLIPDAQDPFQTMEASHIFPTSMIQEWNRNNYKGNWITDDSPSSEIGESGLYSLQNGLLLNKTVHSYFDDFKLGIDPDAGYKIIIFRGDTAKLGGKCPKDSARHGTDPRNRVCAHLLRWHLRMCVYRNLKANADIQAVWEDDLGSDDVGQILEQPDAGHRMEVELFTRLGERMA